MHVDQLRLLVVREGLNASLAPPALVQARVFLMLITLPLSGAEEYLRLRDFAGLRTREDPELTTAQWLQIQQHKKTLPMPCLQLRSPSNGWEPAKGSKVLPVGS